MLTGRCGLRWVVLATVLLFAACGGGAQQPTAPVGSSTTGPSAGAHGSPPAGTTRPTPTPTGTVGAASERQRVGLVRLVASLDAAHSEVSTGMVLTADGEVVTNAHGVTGAVDVRATVVSTGRTYVARVVGEDRGHDVALLQLTGASDLAAVHLTATAARVGDGVTAVGDAGGRTAGLTATTGSVVALDQRLVAPATATSREERLSGLVLVSCAVQPGMSGGPAYDGPGQVVGMVTAAVHLESGPAAVLIPGARVRAVVADLRDS